MEAEKLQTDMSRLFAETAARLNQEVLAMQQHVLQSLKQLEERSAAVAEQLAEQARRDAKRKERERPAASFGALRLPAKAPAGSFGAWLSEASMPIRVGGEELHVHTSLLRTIPYFEGLLRGAWRDALRPQVDLPCSVSEFCLLLQRLYTGEALGTPALPVKDGATAVRLTAAAAMLLIDTAIPELPAVLRGSIKTDEDCEVAIGAADSLPGPLGEIARSFRAPGIHIPEDDLRRMIESTTTQHAQVEARRVLAAQHGEAKKGAVTAASRALLGRARTEADVKWAISIAQEHLDCREVTEVFKAAPAQRSCSCGSERFTPPGVYEAFLQHLQRCSEQGCAVEALHLGFKQSSRVSYHTVTTGYGYVCQVTEVSVLALHGGSCTGLAAALQDSHSELPILAECLSQMPAAQLAEVLGKEVLQALVQYVEGPIAALAASPTDARHWVTVGRLEMLPRAAQLVIARGLLPVLGSLSPSVAVEITRLLA